MWSLRHGDHPTNEEKTICACWGLSSENMQGSCASHHLRAPPPAGAAWLL